MTRTPTPAQPLTELLELDAIFDVSLVDTDRAEERDPEAVTLLVKAESFDVVETERAEFSEDERKKLAASGAAMPDGCLAGETPVVTERGVRPIRDLLGATRVLTDAGWCDAEIRWFGRSPLREVHLARGEQVTTVYATPNHRWLLGDGRWVETDTLPIGAAVPHVEIRQDLVCADSFQPTKRSVARVAQQAANTPGNVVMVNMEPRPLLTTYTSTADLGFSATQHAPPILGGGYALEVNIRQPVLTAQDSVPANKPSGRSLADPRRTHARLGTNTELALGAPSARLTQEEVSVRANRAAQSTGERTFVIDGGASPLPGRIHTTADAGAVIVKLAKAPGQRRNGALGEGTDRFVHQSTVYHERNGWTIESVQATSRYEDVFCAVVPDLHRFVIAGGILTGNSFPIRNAADLHNAMQAIGRAKNPDAAKAHIRKRAAALGLESELTEAFKADELADLAEAEKAGAEFSTKNRSVLASMLAALKKLLGEEAKEPEHADIAAQLEAASKADVGEAPADGAVVEEDDVSFTLDELKGAISEATAPLAERLAALETAKAAPAEPVVAEKAATIVARPLEETIQDAIATYEARKAGGFAAAQAGSGTFPLLNTNGRQQLREIAKAVPREQRPSLEEALRVLTGRDVFTGNLPTEE